MNAFDTLLSALHKEQPTLAPTKYNKADDVSIVIGGNAVIVCADDVQRIRQAVEAEKKGTSALHVSFQFICNLVNEHGGSRADGGRMLASILGLQDLNESPRIKQQWQRFAADQLLTDREIKVMSAKDAVMKGNASKEQAELVKKAQQAEAEQQQRVAINKAKKAVAQQATPEHLSLLSAYEKHDCAIIAQLIGASFNADEIHQLVELLAKQAQPATTA